VWTIVNQSELQVLAAERLKIFTTEITEITERTPKPFLHSWSIDTIPPGGMLLCGTMRVYAGSSGITRDFNHLRQFDIWRWILDASTQHSKPSTLNYSPSTIQIIKDQRKPDSPCSGTNLQRRDFSTRLFWNQVLSGWRLCELFGLPIRADTDFTTEGDTNFINQHEEIATKSAKDEDGG
jgi:hypothetical protein